MSRRPKYPHALMRWQWENGFYATLKDLGAAHGCPDDSYVRRLKMQQGWGDPKTVTRRIVDQVVQRWIDRDSNLLAHVLELKLTLGRALFGMAGNALKMTEYVDEGGVKVERQTLRPKTLDDVLNIVAVSGRLTGDAVRIAAAAAKVDLGDDLPGGSPGPAGIPGRRPGGRVMSAQQLIESLGAARGFVAPPASTAAHPRPPVPAAVPAAAPIVADFTPTPEPPSEEPPLPPAAVGR